MPMVDIAKNNSKKLLKLSKLNLMLLWLIIY